MKPTKNRIYCPDCGRAKILFESEKKALNYIKFNTDEIVEQSGKAPVRAYYCEVCGGYHVTSVKDSRYVKTRVEEIKDFYRKQKQALIDIREIKKQRKRNAHNQDITQSSEE